MNHYFKEIVSNEVRLSDGRTASFEPIGNDSGILKTEDPKLIGMLDELIKQRRGGVIPITPEKYEELLKKKGGSLRPKPRLQDPPQYPIQAASPDARDVAVADRISSSTSHKRFGFAGEAKGAPPAQTQDAKAPAPPTAPAPAGDAAVNRPTPKKVAPSTAPPGGPPGGNPFP